MSDTLRELTHCLVQEFDVAPELARPDAALASLGLDSLALVELSLMVEDRLGATVTDLDGNATLAELAATVDRATGIPHPTAAGVGGAR